MLFAVPSQSAFVGEASVADLAHVLAVLPRLAWRHAKDRTVPHGPGTAGGRWRRWRGLGASVLLVPDQVHVQLEGAVEHGLAQRTGGGLFGRGFFLKVRF